MFWQNLWFKVGLKDAWAIVEWGYLTKQNDVVATSWCF